LPGVGGRGRTRTLVTAVFVVLLLSVVASTIVDLFS
jgi:hypothetical protein